MNRFDEKTNANKKSIVDGIKLAKELPKTAQYGVTLKFVIENSPCNNCIPPVVEKCVNWLLISERESLFFLAFNLLIKILIFRILITAGIETDGIFRRSGKLMRINELKKLINSGENVNFDGEDIYVVAGLLKSFFRELTEPLLTFELYDEIVRFLGEYFFEFCFFCSIKF